MAEPYPKPGLAFKGATLFPSLLLIEDASKGLQQPVFYAEHRRLGGYRNMGVIRRRTAQAYNQSYMLLWVLKGLG
jgi:hypothetical protein